MESQTFAAPLPLTLSPDEALVLFEFLSRWEQEERLEVAHPAEEVVLTQLLGRLEGHLVTPFAADYREWLAAARARVQRSQG